MTQHDFVNDILPASDKSPGPLTDESDAAAAADEADIIPESSDDGLFDVFGDDVSRSALLACSHTPMTAEELAKSCEVSESTIYRRLETLSSLGLIEWAQRIDTPSKTCYEMVVDGLSIHLSDNLRIEAGSSNYVIDAMRMPLAAIDVQQLVYNREQNSVDVRLRLVPTLLDSLVELHIRDADLHEK